MSVPSMKIIDFGLGLENEIMPSMLDSSGDNKIICIENLHCPNNDNCQCNED